MPQPVTLDKISPPRQEGGDALFLQEKRDYDAERQALELRKLKEELAHRNTYSQKIFRLLSLWLVAVFAVVAFEGVGWLEISDSVLISLISGTTINVIGLFTIVARYFFRYGS